MTDLARNELDAPAWLRRWDRQQGGYVPEREETFALMLDVLERLGAAPGRLLDLGCGPGSLADRALARFPGAHVVGLDLDPVMLELGRRTLGDRIQWVEADLRSPGWPGALARGRFDAVVSATALHWLDAGRLPALAEGITSVLRPGGVFVNFDTVLVDPANPRLAALTKDLRVARTDSRTSTARVRGLLLVVGLAGRGAGAARALHRAGSAVRPPPPRLGNDPVRVGGRAAGRRLRRGRHPDPGHGPQAARRRPLTRPRRC